MPLYFGVADAQGRYVTGSKDDSATTDDERTTDAREALRLAFTPAGLHDALEIANECGGTAGVFAQPRCSVCADDGPCEFCPLAAGVFCD